MDYALMRAKVLAVLSIAFTLSACGEEPPRAVSFFETNAEEREAVLAACEEGSHRGAECDNAREADRLVAQEQEAEDRRSTVESWITR